MSEIRRQAVFWFLSNSKTWSAPRTADISLFIYCPKIFLCLKHQQKLDWRNAIMLVTLSDEHDEDSQTLKSQISNPLIKLGILISGNVLMMFMVSGLMADTGAIAAHFQASGNAALRAELVMLSPTIALIVAAPVVGILIPRLGRKWPFIAGLVLYTLAGSAGLFLNGFWGILVSRIILGLAGGAITTIATALTGDYFTGNLRRWAVTLVSMAPAPASIVAILISGALVETGGWHMAFAIYCAAVPVLIMALIFIQEPQQAARRTAGGGRLPRLFPVLCLTAVVCVLSAVLPAVELPFLLMQLNIYSAGTVSIMIATSTCVAAFMGIFYPVLRRYLSPINVIVLMLGAAAVTYFGLSMSSSKMSVGAALLVIGIATGLIYPHFNWITIERATSEARGRAVGIMMSSISLGQILVPFVSAPIRVAVGERHMLGYFAWVLVGLVVLVSLTSAVRKAPAVAQTQS
jgi:MFS family permease